MIDLHSTRRQWLFAMAREAGDRHFDPATGLCLIPRDTLWYATALLFDPSEERRAIGKALCETLPAGDGTHTPASMIALLNTVSEHLSPVGLDHLHEAIAGDLGMAAGVVWRDGNVNHPLGAYATLVLGGECAGQSWATDLGKRRLLEFQRITGDRRHRVHRQAEMSEYMSLTYTALDLVFLSLIGEFAHDSEARALGRWLEERLWLDVALHFHAPSEQFAGPHSRSYQEDSTGGFSALHAVVHAASERTLFMNPALSVRFDHPSTLLQSALAAIAPLHFPPAAQRLMWEKPLPFLMRKSTYCEQYHENAADAPGPFDDEVVPGGWRELSTYMTEEFALGSASLPYVNAGHADSLVLRIRRSPEIGAMKDFRSLYTRGVFNGSMVGRANRCHVTGGLIDASYLYEESRCAVYQHRDRAIVFATPKRTGHTDITEFRLDVLAGWYEPFDAMALGGRPVDRLPVEAGPSARFCFHDYRTYGVIIPLELSPASDSAPIRLHTFGEHLMLSLVNYSGPVTSVSRDEVNGWRNGFFIHLMAAEEFASFEEFVRWAGEVNVSETLLPGFIRQVVVESPDGPMCARYDPFRELFLSRTFRGEEDVTDHLSIEAGVAGESLLSPLTLFGSEARPA